jgi:hypothetical protein
MDSPLAIVRDEVCKHLDCKSLICLGTTCKAFAPSARRASRGRTNEVERSLRDLERKARRVRFALDDLEGTQYDIVWWSQWNDDRYASIRALYDRLEDYRETHDIYQWPVDFLPTLLQVHAALESDAVAWALRWAVSFALAANAESGIRSGLYVDFLEERQQSAEEYRRLLERAGYHALLNVGGDRFPCISCNSMRVAWHLVLNQGTYRSTLEDALKTVRSTLVESYRRYARHLEDYKAAKSAAVTVASQNLGVSDVARKVRRSSFRDRSPPWRDLDMKTYRFRRSRFWQGP